MVCVVVKDRDDAPLRIPHGHIVLDELFCRLHRLKITSKVRLDSVTSARSSIACIQIQPTHSLVSYCLSSGKSLGVSREQNLVNRSCSYTMGHISGLQLPVCCSLFH